MDSDSTNASLEPSSIQDTSQCNNPNLTVDSSLPETDSMEGREGALTHELLASEVSVIDSVTESELGQKVEEETIGQVASLEDLVSDIEIPDDKDVASVAGFTEIPNQDKGLEGIEPEFVKEESLKELQVGEGALVDGEAKEDAAMGSEVLSKTEEEEKVNAFTVLEIPQEVNDVANEVSVMDDVKEDVEKDPEVVEEVETDDKYGAEIEKEEGDEMVAVGEGGSVVLEESRELSEELGKGDETKVDEVSEETKTIVKDENEEKVGDLTDLVDDVETRGDPTVAVTDEEMGMTEETQEETVDLDENRQLSEELAKGDQTTVAEETETIIKDVDEEKVGDLVEDEEKVDDMTDLAEDVETHGDSTIAVTEEGTEDDEEMGMTEETHEETVTGEVDETKVAALLEETETEIKDEDEEKDEDMADVLEDVEKDAVSSEADVEEENENLEEMETTETQEESVMAETGDEEPEEVEEENKSVGGKRKRVKGTGKKKEEDVCFMCFDGGDLVLCDRRGCPKAYHPACVDRDEEFFRSKGKWNCGWHLCSKCEKSATYLCFTCMFSLCKGCAKDAAFFCIRGNKGLCETCMETVKLIEKKEQEKEPAQLDFTDKTSWEYLFKDYWIDLKTQLTLTPKEIDQAKSPRKVHESHASKQGTGNENDSVTDGGSDSDSSPKKRKTRSRSKSGSAEKIRSPAKKKSSGETIEWASKELLDVVAHMRRGDRSFLPQAEVHALLLDYIKRYNLRDPRRKSQVVCDTRLQNLFGKSHVGHFEMLNLLETHFLKTEQQEANDIQSSIVDTEPDQVDVDENDQPMKNGKDKKRKTRKKGGRKGRQSNLDDFAAINMHNINLIYLRRSLVEDLLEDSAAFEEKVASAFVRLRISGNQKQDLYRLVQVVGTSKAPESYKVGKKTTDYVLEILNLDKTEVISIDIISNQDFTEDECKRLKQSIKCGLINRLTVGDIQGKAIALQEVRVKNLLEAEILRFSHLRDRASDMGRRKELRECVEKLQLLKSPEERQRRLEEIPEIHADPKMDPDCESEDEDDKEEKEKAVSEKQLRPRSSSFNRRARDPTSPRKGGFCSNESPRKGGFSPNESWSTSNYSNSSAHRELSRSYSGRGSTSRGDYPGSSEDKSSDSMWTSGREREMQQSLGSEKPRSVSIPETPVRSSRAAAPLELSPRIAPQISTTPPAVVPQTVPKSNDSEKVWHYKDPSGKVQGPFSMAQLRKWNNTGYFPAKLEIWKANESPLDSTLLTDALAGIFQKQPQSVDSSYMKAQVATYSGQSSQSEHSLGSIARTAPSKLDIPRNSQDTWNSGGGLPSPTPNQVTTPTAKRRSFESRWSPTKPAAQSAVQSMNFSVAQSGPSQASRTDIPVVVNSAGALQHGTHPIPAPYGSAPARPSPTPTGGKQSWGSMQAVDALSSSQISSATYGTVTPSVLPSHSQPGFPPSDSWRAPVPSQTNAHVQANNLPWGVNNSQNSGQPQAPTTQSWSQGAVNPTGWVAPVQGGMNGNWAASTAPQTGQGIPNPGWSGPVQGQQPQTYSNTGWGVTGQGSQAQAQPQAQAPGTSTGPGWMQPSQGMMQSGNSNQNWGTQNQTTIASGGSGGNQAGYWGNQQSQNGDSSGYGWNRQSSGSGGQNNNFKGQRVCKFFREEGYCRKGASCNYLHN